MDLILSLELLKKTVPDAPSATLSALLKMPLKWYQEIQTILLLEESHLALLALLNTFKLSLLTILNSTKKLDETFSK
jgi:hypothetical protein